MKEPKATPTAHAAQPLPWRVAVRHENGKLIETHVATRDAAVALAHSLSDTNPGRAVYVIDYTDETHSAYILWR